MSIFAAHPALVQGHQTLLLTGIAFGYSLFAMSTATSSRCSSEAVVFTQNIRIFYAVSLCHSFTAAARQLGITQSAVSQGIAALEKQLGMPAENLEKTVAEYNKMVEAKSDTKFGRKLFDQKIEKAPFYATPRAPSIHHTMGGLEINTKAQVVDVLGNPIPGLYAAGEVTGGIHGSNRLGGNATADVLTFGRIAAKSALGIK